MLLELQQVDNKNSSGDFLGLKTVGVNTSDFSQTVFNKEELQALTETKKRFSVINSKAMAGIDKINSNLYLGAIEYLTTNCFCWVEVPTLTKITGACENVDTLYNVDHFGTEAYLAQTGQLYLEAKIPSHKKVWTIITSSRAESVVDERHLNQFTLIEFEHLGDLNLLLAHIQGTIQNMVKRVLKKNREELSFLGVENEHVQKYLEPFTRITYTHAITLLQTTFPVQWGDDLKAQHELFLVEALGNKPLFITHYPKAIKFFNMRQNEENSDVVNSADLILPYSGESTGSAERENNYEHLQERLITSPMYHILQVRGKNLEDFEDYLQLVKQNPQLHSGCGIGFNRVSQSILQMPDIRMATNYPLNAESLY